MIEKLIDFFERIIDNGRTDRMQQIECAFGHRGEWRDCGDGTIIYFVEGKPIIDSLEMI